MHDIAYYVSLLVCVVLGNFYKKIEDVEMKRNYGTGLGILIACLICGVYIFHTIFLVWGNIITIKCCDKRFVHQVSLVFTWLYMLYLHLNVECSKYTIWLNQTVALRMVGLAYEINIADRIKSEPKTSTSSAKMVEAEEDTAMFRLTAADIIAYAYYFIGLHRGPYYRWKTFNEHFTTPFSGLGDCRMITEQKLKKAVLCLVGYWLLQRRYTVDIYYDNNFYESYGTDYRYLSNVPHLIMYFFEYQCLMMLCTSVFTETGFGVYPAKCRPTAGYGPTSQLDLLKLTAGEPEVLQQEYNFGMLQCFDNDKLLMGPKMKDTMRGWDMPTRYWFWAYMFKNSFLKSNKEVRSAWTFLTWTIWVGPSKQQWILSLTLWVYVHLESEYSTWYNTTGSMKGAWNIGFSIMRILCLIYLTPCLVVDDTEQAMKYYHSIYWIFHGVLLVLTMAAVVMYKSHLQATSNLPPPPPPNISLKLRRLSMMKAPETPASAGPSGSSTQANKPSDPVAASSSKDKGLSDIQEKPSTSAG